MRCALVLALSPKPHPAMEHGVFVAWPLLPALALYYTGFAGEKRSPPSR